jgi:nucleotide-binding universal stress UspA family protein
MKGYRKVLIAVNGATKVMDDGLGLAFDEGCWVTILKVLPPYEGDLNLTGIRNISDVITSEAEKVEVNLKQRAQALRSLARVRVETGKIPETIGDVAASEGCDLIIMGGRGKKRGFFRRLFGDRVVERVVQLAPCPVLVLES